MARRKPSTLVARAAPAKNPAPTKPARPTPKAVPRTARRDRRPPQCYATWRAATSTARATMSGPVRSRAAR